MNDAWWSGAAHMLKEFRFELALRVSTAGHEGGQREDADNCKSPEQGHGAFYCLPAALTAEGRQRKREVLRRCAPQDDMVFGGRKTGVLVRRTPAVFARERGRLDGSS